MTRPQSWRVTPRQTLWVDWSAPRAIGNDGAAVPLPNPCTLTDLLWAASLVSCDKIMLTAGVPTVEPDEMHWLMEPTPGWAEDEKGHWIRNGPATGRFVHQETGFKVQVRTAAEWGMGDASPEDARAAWDAMDRITAKICLDLDGKPTSRLQDSPAATGLGIWAVSLPKSGKLAEQLGDMDPIDPEEAALIHFTAGQHRIEHLVEPGPDPMPGACTCGACAHPIAAVEDMDFMSYVDGRMMYASLLGNLGIGPARRLTAAQTVEALRGNQYTRARIRLRFKVPDNWRHVGILGVKIDGANDEKAWHFPNKPGTVWETWCDSSEAFIAVNHGWEWEAIESMVWEGTKVCDVFGNRMKKAAALAQTDNTLTPTVRKLAHAGLRMILLTSIGSWASRGGRPVTRVYDNAWELTPEMRARAERYGDRWVITEPHTAREALPTYRPELAAQVWGLARARVLHHKRKHQEPTGALTIHPSKLLGIYGDALYCRNVIPRWSLPTEHGGEDDGSVGRLRLKGIYRAENGPVPVPGGTAARNVFRGLADTAGWTPADISDLSAYVR